MNALARTFADFTRTLEKFTREPLAADLFEWCAETDTYAHIRWALSVHGVPFEPSTPVSDLKARLERKVEQEHSRRFRKHWSFDVNRLRCFEQMLATIHEFRRTA